MPAHWHGWQESIRSCLHLFNIARPGPYVLKPQKTQETTPLKFHQLPKPKPLEARACELIRMFPATAG